MPNHCRFIAEFSVESSSHTLDWRLMSQFHWDSLFPCYIYHFWIYSDLAPGLTKPK